MKSEPIGKKTLAATERAEGVHRLPADETKLWRYMDLEKFLSLLQRGAIAFSRSDALGDPFEGSFTTPGFLQLQWVSSLSRPGEEQEDLRRRRRTHELMRKSSFVSCWHAKGYESEAMWKIYSASNASIAVQTTIGKLKSLLPDDVILDSVRYVNFDAFPTAPYAGKELLWLKRNSFEHEHEVRAVKTVRIELRDLASYEEKVQFVPIDIGSLIENVFVNPTAPGWLLEVVTDVARKYELQAPVLPSSLAADPLF